MKIYFKKKEASPDFKHQYGYSYEQIPDTFDTNRILICLIKGILIFCAALGTIGGVVSAFDFSVNMTGIFLFVLIGAVSVAMLHCNHILFNISYPLLFVIFAFSIIQNKAYVNSGYHAMTNIVREGYRDYFEMDYSMQAAETIANRYQTMTIALIFLGFFLIVLLNITVSNHMSLFWTAALTFPLLIIGLYIGKLPDPIYIALLLFSYVSITLLKRSGHYTLSENRKKDRPFVKQKQMISYKGHGRTMGQMTLMALLLSFCFSMAVYPFMRSDILSLHSKSSLKLAVDPYVKIFVQNGLSGLFSRYEASGGISGGKLGGISSVRTNHEPDLEVTYAPASSDTVYLKAFTGSTYTGDSWNPLLSDDYWDQYVIKKYGAGNIREYSDFTAHLEAKRLSYLQEKNPEKAQSGKMQVKNVGAEEEYLYLPYYTAQDSPSSYITGQGIIGGESPLNQPYMVEYYPYSQDFSELVSTYDNQLRKSPQIDDMHIEFMSIYDVHCTYDFLDIPEDLQPVMEEKIKEIPEADTTIEQLQNIKNYIAEHYQYSLAPGVTPSGQDFVSYFLEKQKRGYCVHFASAGTMLCRAFGIPARYAEGYVIRFSDLANGSIDTEEEVSDWLTGASELESTGVVTVSVPDSNAHAWTEVYLDGFGWIPVDFTPPSMVADEEEEYSSFFDLLSGLFTSGGTGANKQSNVVDGQVDSADLWKDNSSLHLSISFVVILLAAALLLWKPLWLLYVLLRRTINYRCGNYEELFSYYYRRLRKRAARSAKNRKPAGSSPEQLPEAFFMELGELTQTPIEAEKACSILERCYYGNNQITKEEAAFFLRYARKTTIK